MSIDEDYYKPKITKGVFNNCYIQYESMGDKGKSPSIKRYLDMIRPYLSNIIKNRKTQGKWRTHSGSKIIERKTQIEWKIQLTMKINFISSNKDSEKTCAMSTKSNNVEVTMGSETDEIIEDLLKSLWQRYQEGLEESVRGSDFLSF